MSALKLSATAIKLLKQCPFAFWLKYRKFIFPTEESENLGLGLAFHDVLAQYYRGESVEEIRSDITEKWRNPFPDRWANLLAAFDAYIAKPPFARIENCDANIDICVEERFHCEVPEHDLILNGVLDLLTEYPDRVVLTEHKSTSSAFGDDRYWNAAKRSIQLSLYDWALSVLYPGKPVEIQYNVWHKAGLRRKGLTIKATKDFLKTGKYLDMEIAVPPENEQVFVGKNLDQLQETPEMFYARLFQRYSTEPSFDCRPVVKLNSNRSHTEEQLGKLVKLVRFMDENDCFCQDEDSCDEYSGCDYRPLCDNNLDVDADELPDTLKKGRDAVPVQ